MSDLYLNETSGDIEISNGDIRLTEGQETIRQHIMQVLRSFKGEWFLDITSGVPYFGEVFKKNPNPLTLDFVFKDAIANCLGVKEITSFDLSLDNAARKLKLEFSVDTIEGNIDFENITIG